MTVTVLQPRRVVVLGSTGSIGRQALDIVRCHPGQFKVVGLAAGHAGPDLLAQLAEFAPEACGAAHVSCDAAGWSDAPNTFAGPDAAASVVTAARADLVINAITGLAGLVPTLAALQPGVTVAMASKESMVAAGSLLRLQAAAAGARIYPVDSETTAVAQCLAHAEIAEVAQIYVTASGGPFWDRDPETFADVQPDEALRHPRWSMGRKISVDSATLFNKGLEVIEISQFFDVPLDRISILVHRQSLAHALVEFRDGAIAAQLGPRDMRISIAQAMYWPKRPPDAPARLPMDDVQLSFVAPDFARWPCLRAALRAAAEGGTAPAAVSAADEVLVRSFLAGAISFNDIGRGLWATLTAHRKHAGDRVFAAGASTRDTANPIAALLRMDHWARGFAARWVETEAGLAPGLAPQEIGEDFTG